MKPAVIAPLLLLFCAGQARPPVAAVSPTTEPKAGATKIDYYSMTPEQFFNRRETQDRYGKGSVNGALLEAAIFQQANIERSRHQLGTFQPSFALNLMARRHSEEMVKLHYFAHESPTPGKRTLVERLRNVGLANVAAAENIAVLPAREMGSGHFIVHYNPDGSESLTDAQTGKPILYDTYQELAESVLDEWMKSPEHRKNMLNKEYAYLGVGAARGIYGDNHQDSFFLTQNFSSAVVPAGEVKAQGELAGHGQANSSQPAVQRP